ncbi:acyl-coenzyme A thioesterase PaaI-like protein [Spinactinospora alkalitolerans]|uniref:Acyl-coenzyme A thioesterase PaaI-like protein n=1 Tax=Spinactinospora alkalitolerans TaxID=687207 RepID=A0A852U309_9ACTN|nr:hypothetical protein [Spinactinospora alkalitolerans]NYE48340.1 acyl-coenzyme A thioesterase PaaI-like protein [Spinactinospora alkalitolerans]
MIDTTDDEVRAELTAASRFNGPPGSANGGYVSGLLARRLGGAAAEVTLRRPPPLDTPMAVRRGDADGLLLLDGDALIAEAVPAPEPAERVGPVPFDVAEEARQRFRGLTGHPFPTCFTCGTDREPGDGLRLHAGPIVAGESECDTVACVWTPHPSLASEGAATVPDEMVWAALDCPGGWSSDVSGRPMVLGRMTAAVGEPPTIGRPHVVVGRLLAVEGRKAFTASALYGADGTVMAAANAVWIMIGR